jgi:hypothetical protein
MFWSEETTYMLVFVTALSIVGFLLGFSHAVRYNNYYNLYSKDFEKFLAGYKH